MKLSAWILILCCVLAGCTGGRGSRSTEGTNLSASEVELRLNLAESYILAVTVHFHDRGIDHGVLHIRLAADSIKEFLPDISCVWRFTPSKVSLLMAGRGCWLWPKNASQPARN